MEISFIGLGATGKRMDLNLVKVGHRLVVRDRTTQRSRILAEGGRYMEVPVCGSRVPAESGQLVAGAPEDMEQAIQKKIKAKPIFAKMLAWFGIFWNGVYLVYTIYNIIHNYPKNKIEYIFVALITIIFGVIYLKMKNNFSIGAYRLSTIMAFIWFVFLAFKFVIMKTKGESIETLFVFGAIYTAIVNIIALHQVKIFHNKSKNKDCL